MKSYIFRCMWDNDASIFHVHLQADDINDARKQFSGKMKKVKKDAQREYCLLGVYREV